MNPDLMEDFHNWYFGSQQGNSEGFESCGRPMVRKRPIWVKIGDVLSHVTWNLMDDIEKQ